MSAAFTDQDRWLCQYVRNTAQVPLALHDFDDDHAPVGEFLREQLRDKGLITELVGSEDGPGGIILTPAGEQLAAS